MDQQNNQLNATSELAVRREKLAALVAAGNDPYTITKYDVSADSASLKESYVDSEDPSQGELVRIAGRMVSRRVMGKASFAHLLDGTGKMQLYVRRDDVGEDIYAGFKKWDIGDIIGVEGFVFRTQTGEVSLHVKKLTLLSKSLLPLPEKFIYSVRFVAEHSSQYFWRLLLGTKHFPHTAHLFASFEHSSA